MTPATVWVTVRTKVSTFLKSDTAQTALEFLSARMREKSSWVGMAAVVGGLGLKLIPAFVDSLAGIAAAGVGVFLFFMKEKGSEK